MPSMNRKSTDTTFIRCVLLRVDRVKNPAAKPPIANARIRVSGERTCSSAITRTAPMPAPMRSTP